METIRASFEQALRDPAAIDRAIRATERFLLDNPDDVVATAYQGSLHAMKAGAALLPWIKLKHANIGSALLDSAHERRLVARHHEAGGTYPAGLEIALLRGVAYANFPAFLGRVEAARLSLEEAVGHPAFDAIPASYRALACAHLAVLYRQAGEGRTAGAFLARALALDETTACPIWTAA